jgi:hypothetical protein
MAAASGPVSSGEECSSLNDEMKSSYPQVFLRAASRESCGTRA